MKTFTPHVSLTPGPLSGLMVSDDIQMRYAARRATTQKLIATLKQLDLEADDAVFSRTVAEMGFDPQL